MKKILLTSAIALFFIACKEKKEAQAQQDTNQPEVENTTIASTSTKDFSTLAGSYYGTFPCASCPGIHYFLNIDKEGNWQEYSRYIDEKDGFTTASGTIAQITDDTFILDEKKFLIKENELALLDMEGNKITSELASSFILKKLPDLSIEQEGVYPKFYQGNNNKTYHLTHITLTKPPVVLLKEENQNPQLFFQKEAWAKGAEYAGKGATLTSKGSKAQLNINHQKIKLTAQQ